MTFDVQFDLDDKSLVLHDTSAAAAEAAADRAEAAAETLSGSVAQIATNTQDITALKEDLSSINEATVITRTVAGTKNVEYPIASGETLRFTSTVSVSVRLRESESGDNLQIIFVPADTPTYAVATSDAAWLSVYFNGSGELNVEKGRFVDAEKTISSVNTELTTLTGNVESLAAKRTLTRTAVGGNAYEQHVAIGDVFRITNDTAKNALIRFRDTETGENKQVGLIPPNSTGFITAAVTAEWIQVYFQAVGSITIENGRFIDVESEAEKIGNVFDLLILEQGGITKAGEYKDYTQRLRTVNYLKGNFKVSAPAGFVVTGIYYFDALGYIVASTSNINSQNVTASVPEGQMCKIVFAKTDTTQDITIEEIKASYVMESFDKRITTLETDPMVEFTYDHDFYANVESIVNEKQYTTNPQSMSQLYEWFDGLIDIDPTYVTKTDIAQELGLTYPRYANGISSGDSEYLETPAYKTYMYKLVCSNSAVNTSRQQKKKVLLFGGVHGDEQAAPFNLYVFAQRLVNDYLTDENIFKLRASCDFYIVPCVNGYGMIHQWRLNGNGVNINRNFPIVKWSKYGEKGQDNYTGETAGSEFETQLVMAIVNSVKPDLLIDHHNYTYNMNSQFYTTTSNPALLKCMYQALTDVSFTLKKNLPSYFGTNFDFVKQNGDAPGAIGNTIGTVSRWGYEEKTPFSATLEIGDCITYNNGVHAGTRQDYYGVNTFKVAEYTLRNQILHYVQWVLDNTL